MFKFAVAFLCLAIHSASGWHNPLVDPYPPPAPMAYKRSPVTSEKAPPPLGAYSQGIRAGFDRQQILLSGTIPLRHDPATGKTELVNGTIEEQAVQVFTNMKYVAEAAGGSLDQIVKVNIFLTDLDDFATVDQVMGRFFSKPYPARSTDSLVPTRTDDRNSSNANLPSPVGVASLLKGVKIEIDGEMRL